MADFTLTRNNTLDHDLPSEIGDSLGLCWFNGYWRIADFTNYIVYALDTDFAIVFTENITSITDGFRMRGLTKTATHLLVLFVDSTNGHYVKMYDTDNNFVMQFTLTDFPSGLGLPQSICYDETNNRILVGSTGPSGGVGHIGAFAIPTIVTGTIPSTALISSASFDLTTGQQRADAMVWYDGYAITIDHDDDRFYVYKLSDQSFVSGINPTGVSPDVQGLGLKDGSLYLVDRTDNAIDGWDIVSTISVPDAPINLDGSEVSSEVTLTWDDPNDDTITGYKIFRKTGSGAYSTLVNNTASTTQSYTDGTVSEGTEYTYKIQAINDTGNSGDSNEFNITTASTGTVPNAPTGLTGTENTDGDVVLTWDDPNDDTITDHAIFRKVGNGTYTELTTSTLITGQTYTDDTAVHQTGYTYKIKAINATGNSADSNEFPFTTAVSDTTAPTIDSGVPLNANVTSTSVQWRVTFSEDVQNVDETDFGIKRVGVANFNPDSVTQISASIYDVFGTLPEPDVYHLRLRGTSDITDFKR